VIRSGPADVKKGNENGRSLSPDEVKELNAYFRIGLSYTSNALEGNSLTLSEPKVLLEDGITVGGKLISCTVYRSFCSCPSSHAARCRPPLFH